MLRITETSFGLLRPLTLEESAHPVCAKNGYCWVVTRPFILKTSDPSISITVAAGFLTDGATGGPDIGYAWLFHDWLYATHMLDSGETCTRELADNIMSMVLQDENMTTYDAVFVWLRRMNLCWCFTRAWTSSGTRGAQTYEAIFNKSFIADPVPRDMTDTDVSPRTA